MAVIYILKKTISHFPISKINNSPLLSYDPHQAPRTHLPFLPICNGRRTASLCPIRKLILMLSQIHMSLIFSWFFFLGGGTCGCMRVDLGDLAAPNCRSRRPWMLGLLRHWGRSRRKKYQQDVSISECLLVVALLLSVLVPKCKCYWNHISFFEVEWSRNQNKILSFQW